MPKLNWIIYTICFIGSLSIMFLPSIITDKPGGWLDSESFDGDRYLVSQEGLITQKDDPIGAKTLINSILNDLNGPLIEFDDSINHIDNLNYALEQANLRVDRIEDTDLQKLPAKFIAQMKNKSSKFIFVRRFNDQYVYALDPKVGNVIYEVSVFEKLWTKEAYVF